MVWLDPRLWLALLGSCAICLLGGFLYGRHEMRGVELAQCQSEKAQAALSLTDALDSIEQEAAKASAARRAQRAAEDKLREQNRDAVHNAAKSLPSCPALPDSLVLRLDAAGTGDFMPADGEPSGVPAARVPSP